LLRISDKLPTIDWFAPTDIDSDKKSKILEALKIDAT